MNKVILMGRLTRDADIRWTQGQEQSCIARYTLAVDRRYSAAEGQQSADFISCVSFGKAAGLIEKYGKQGIKLIIDGRIQTGSYEKNGQRIYTTDVVVEHAEFAESKKSENANNTPCDEPLKENKDGFMNIADGIDEDIPFN